MCVPNWTDDLDHGLINYGNICTVNVLAQAVLCPIVEDINKTFEAWDPEGSTLCNALLGVSAERGLMGRAAASAALKAAIENGGDLLQRMKLGHDGPGLGPQLDMEDMMERAFTTLRQEDPMVMRCIDWHIACQGTCGNLECPRFRRSVTVNVSCNPVVMQPCPDGRDDAQDMLTRLRGTTASVPRPCPDCSVDMAPNRARYVGEPPHIVVVHTRRAMHDSNSDSSRVEFPERVNVQGHYYQLFAIARYTDPGEETTIQGGHHSAYCRQHRGPWVLQDDTYSREATPTLDDLANTTAAYSTGVPPNRLLQEASASPPSSEAPPGEDREADHHRAEPPAKHDPGHGDGRDFEALARGEQRGHEEADVPGALPARDDSVAGVSPTPMETSGDDEPLPPREMPSRPQPTSLEKWAARRVSRLVLSRPAQPPSPERSETRELLTLGRVGGSVEGRIGQWPSTPGPMREARVTRCH